MSQPLAHIAGHAMLWRGAQLVGTRVIFLARLLILARLLAPDDYGLMAIASTALVMLVNVTDLGVIPALIQSNDQSKKNYDVGWTLGVIRATVISLVLWITAPLVADLFNEPRAVGLIQALAVVPMLDAVSSILVVKLIRELRFGSLAALELAKAMINMVVAISLANSFGVWAMIFGTVAGSAIYAIGSYLLAPYWPGFALDRSALKPLLRFGRWMLMTAITATVGTLMLRAIISRGLGTAELGLYFFAISIAKLPIGVATEVIARVAFPLYTRVGVKTEKSIRTFRIVLVAMMLIVVPSASILVVLAPYVILDLVDARWADSTLIIQILAVSSVIGVLSEALIPWYLARGNPARITALESVQTGTAIFLAFVFIDAFGLPGVACAFLAGVTLSQLLNMVFIKRLSIPWPEGLMKLAIVIGSASLAGAIVAGLCRHFIPGIPGLCFALALGFSTVLSLLVLCERKFHLGLWHDLVTAYPQLGEFGRR